MVWQIVLYSEIIVKTDFVTYCSTEDHAREGRGSQINVPSLLLLFSVDLVSLFWAFAVFSHFLFLLSEFNYSIAAEMIVLCYA